MERIKRSYKFRKAFIVITLLWIGVSLIYGLTPSLNVNEEIEIIPQGRKPGVFHENHSDSASVAKLEKHQKSYLFSYTKSKKTAYAFAGAYFPLESMEVNMSDFDQIDIELEAEKGKRYPIRLSLHYGDTLVRYLTSFIEYEQGKKEYSLHISEFTTPTEWFEEHGLSAIDLPVNSLDQIQTLSIESCHLLGREIDDKVKISSIRFKQNKHASLLLLFLVYLILISGILIYGRITILKNQKIKTIPIEPSQVEQGELLIDQITLYLSKAFKNADLKINDVQKATGIHKKKIAEELKIQYQLSFPQYLAQVRIEESKRLLIKEPNLTIAEVGYMVGFNTPNNFNRVFKALEEKTPNQFRESSSV